MATLTVTGKGQVTLEEDLLHHLGVAPGQDIEVAKLPGGKLEIKAATPTGTIDEFIGVLSRTATIEEIDDAAAAGWARRK